MNDKNRIHIINNNKSIKRLIDTIEDCQYRQSLIFYAISQAQRLSKPHMKQVQLVENQKD